MWPEDGAYPLDAVQVTASPDVSVGHGPYVLAGLVLLLVLLTKGSR